MSNGEQRSPTPHGETMTAPFLIGHSWKEVSWRFHGGSVHAAVLAKAGELGATAWDYGQARRH